ncbi:carbohydrate-binding module family 50 [Hypoxylon crocopeplum]|nr:carbohydrate-binding module family 50 [Hypoxylon crocopeplum]
MVLWGSDDSILRYLTLSSVFTVVLSTLSNHSYLFARRPARLLFLGFLSLLTVAMKFLRDPETRSPRLLSFPFYIILSLLSVVAADDCQPSTWTVDARPAAPTPFIASNATIRLKSASVALIGAVEPGEINCRYRGSTYEDVNYYTCTQLAERYEITIEKFFMLNPDLDPDCGNIQPNTDYCVDGFIEPVRATDGHCGPPNNNATCLGNQSGQCCNAETWTCGNSTADCAPGTCYEGACVGDNIYSTDGTCGYAYGNRLCIGKWGDCCSLDGACGTGVDFCGEDVCQSGNCTRPNMPSPAPTLGNTTDGTCGGA